MAVFPTPDLYQADIWAHRKIGILGGSFNPAHEGHRHISLMALKKLKLDAVWWLVTPQNPLKGTNETAPLKARIQQAYEMANHPHICVTSLESKLKTTYTAETLPKIKQYFPKTHFVWMMGMDNLHTIHHWEKWQEIFHTMPICILNRPPHDDAIQNSIAAQSFKKYQIPETSAAKICDHTAPAWTILNIPLNALSSTAIRAEKSDI